MAVEVEMVSVAAIIQDGIANLIDVRGRKIARVSLSIIGPIDSQCAMLLGWESWAERQNGRANAQYWKHKRDPFESTILSLTKSVNLRMVNVRAYGGGKRFSDKYKTCNWEDAIKRMYFQLRQRGKRGGPNCWIRWSETKSNNLGKREGGKYGVSNKTFRA